MGLAYGEMGIKLTVTGKNIQERADVKSLHFSFIPHSSTRLQVEGKIRWSLLSLTYHQSVVQSTPAFVYQHTLQEQQLAA